MVECFKYKNIYTTTRSVHDTFYKLITKGDTHMLALLPKGKKAGILF